MRILTRSFIICLTCLVSLITSNPLSRHTVNTIKREILPRDDNGVMNYDYNTHLRNINEFQLSDLLLVSDIEGGLHALKRETGEIIWSLDVEAPLVQVETNLTVNKDNDEERVDDLIWIVEPYNDGNLYFFNDDLGLNKLPISISQLVLQSPFALKNDDKIYTGVRKTSLYQIDFTTGEIISSFGDSTPINKPEKLQNNIINIGKTTYDLTIHSKDNIHWNVTYSSWGPNNIDVDLVYQNKFPIDNTYIAPFHDSSLLAIDLDSKIAKWVSQLQQTIVNVFDILETPADQTHIILPHPLKPPTPISEKTAVYLDVTSKGCWYAMSSDYYPSLVKSAPSSRYSLSERWRNKQLLKHNEFFKESVIGVHYPSINNPSLHLTNTMIGYPTQLPIQPPPSDPASQHTTLKRSKEHNEVNTYNSPAPPSRSEYIGLPSTINRNYLKIDPPGYDDSFFDTTFGRFIYRCFENLVMILLLVLFIFTCVKFKIIPSLSVLLKINGLELKQVVNENQEIEINEGPSKPSQQEAIRAGGGEVVKTTKPKKEVKIVEPEKSEGESTAVEGQQEVQKRKRGSRGGKKLKNKQNQVAVKDDDSPGLKTIKLSDIVLGYGSYGTVVYKGSFQNRDVAVKRMLIEFYDVASHEISLLTESDDHPNVVRYFYSESNDKFLYIALELCSASIEDIIEKPDAFKEFLGLMDPVNVLEQIALGLNHLHTLKIVHRDIKPQNILVAPLKKFPISKTNPQGLTHSKSSIRVLISDFGLCKKLEADESSFRATTQHAAGTSGWRAPELLIDSSSMLNNGRDYSESSTNSTLSEPVIIDAFSKRKLTRGIDIFSLGCVYYYILTNGGHPFGDRYLREGNVIKGDYNIDGLDILPDNLVEAKDLIRSMIAKNPKERPHITQVLKHPFFWDNGKKLDFLLKVSDRFEVERRDPPSELLLKLEGIAPNVILDGDWCGKFDRLFMDNLGKYRKYYGNKIMDLLRALRNKYHHFNDLPEGLNKKMSPLPDGFYQYFNVKFPNLLMEIYWVVEENLIDDHVLRKFF